MLELKNITKTYGKKTALEDVSVAFGPGQIVGLFGENGAGKSTLFRCLLGGIDGYSGAIELDGREVRGLSRREMAARIAYIPQIHRPTFGYSVLDTALMGLTRELSPFRSPTAEQEKRAMEALEQANTTLQNRFSPALGARAAEIFSAITAGRYDRVLLSRDFSLSAEPAGDPVGRSIRLLSQGAADQLYLAVRLAICDMVLPEEKRVPLILDDALVSFDDDRLHAALDYLLTESEKRQILLFSCQKREMDYLSGRKNVTVGCL